MQLSQLSAFWQRLTAFQRLSLISLLFFLVILPVGIWLTLSPTSPFSRAQNPVTSSDKTSSPTSLSSSGNFAQPGFGFAFGFNGSTAVTIPAGRSVYHDTGLGFTMEAWIKPASTEFQSYIFSRGDANQNNFNVLVTSARDASSGNFTVNYLFSAANQGSNCNMFSMFKERVIPADRAQEIMSWQHIAAVVEPLASGGDMRMFVNGEGSTVSSNSVVGTCYKKTPPIYVGARRVDDSFDTFFNGLIDEVRFSRSARYSSDFTPPTSGFVVDSSTPVLLNFNDRDLRNLGTSGAASVTGNAEYIGEANPTPSPSPSPTPIPPSPPPQTLNFTIGLGYTIIGSPLDRIPSSAADYRAENFLQDLNRSFQPASQSGQTVTSGDKIRNIFRYNTDSGRWEIHTLGRTADDNFRINRGEAYFVRSTWPGTTTQDGGSPASLPTHRIPPGWSLISPSSDFSDAAVFIQAVQSQGINTDMLVRWGGGRYTVYNYGSAANKFQITPGEGYWIKNIGEAKIFNLSDARPSKRAFVTYTSYSGNLGGLSGADAKCQQEAGSLGGTWKAWLSDNTGSPATRFVKHYGPYRLLDNTIIAHTWDDLIDGTLLSPLNINRNREVVSSRVVWTNTKPDGTVTDTRPEFTCNNWSSWVIGGIGVSGRFGQVDNSNGEWTYVWNDNVQEVGSQGCGGGGMTKLYCFEQ